MASPAAVCRTIFSPAGVSIVTRPELFGSKLEALALQASSEFVETVLKPIVPESSAADSSGSVGWCPTVLEILNGGRYYFMPAAIENVLGVKPRVASLRAKRRLDEEGQWRVDIWERSGADLNDGPEGPIVIGDTVATGTTLAGVLAQLVEEMKASSPPRYRDIYVFAIAGSDAAAPKLVEVAETLATAGCKLQLVLANCALELADNGTDLKFRESACAESVWDAIREALAPLPPSAVKCAVFDWGDRFTKPADHLAEVSEWAHHLPDDTPGVEALRARIREAASGISES